MTAELLFAGLIGLVVGSFLCLVAHRLPVMLERAWAADAAQAGPGGEASTAGAVATAPYNLLRPPSHCPACHHRLGIHENLPLISWLLQGGRCRACNAAIGWREPLMEATAAGLAMLAIWRFGIGWSTGLAAVFLWSLLLLSTIDLQRGWLPDELTQPLLWLGLLANLDGRYTPIEDAVIGAAAGYLGLWIVYWAFRLSTGREGMGIGDLHLLAAIGAWVGWQTLPGLVLFAAVIGLAWAGWSIWALRRPSGQPMPFGPMLSIGGVLALVQPDLLIEPFVYGWPL